MEPELAIDCNYLVTNTQYLSKAGLASHWFLSLQPQENRPKGERLGRGREEVGKYMKESFIKMERLPFFLPGIIMLLLSPFSLTAFYCLLWSLSYIFFPDALWGKAACLRLQCREN